MKLNTFTIINHLNNDYWLDTDKLLLFQIDEKVKKFLKYAHLEEDEIYDKTKDIFTKDELDNLLKTIKENGLINEVVDNKIKDVPNISSITLMLIQGCNLACSYCFGDGGTYNNKGLMTEEIAKKSIDFLIKNSTSKKLNVTFFGGEPLLNFSLIKHIISYCNDIEKSSDIKFYYNMTTNGTLINDEISKFIIDNKINTMISIDGGEEHNKERVYLNKEPAYNDIINNTKTLRAKGLLASRPTITPSNLNLIDVFNKLDNLNFNKIPMACADNIMDIVSYNDYLNENLKLISFFKDLIDNNKYDIAKKINMIHRALVQLNSAKVQKSPCGASINMVAIDINGDIFPCHRFVSSETHKIGNVNFGIDRETFIEQLSNEDTKFDECNNCTVKMFCRGSCPYENYNNTKILNRPSIRQCYFNKVFFTQIIHLYLDLSDGQKEKLFNN
ncbi:PapB family radical SAM/SPASM ranthipeptide maturase [[Clostridium] colinum]|uniref:PapB family radical SAM/SPASM ranthipeptide maturase n=1 Tax=[Clostridium] colinum TaxID=36835 RepID=UPI00202460E9|nr:SPASM domain-containing protein [[Clostridium] colinum]